MHCDVVRKNIWEHNSVIYDFFVNIFVVYVICIFVQSAHDCRTHRVPTLQLLFPSSPYPSSPYPSSLFFPPLKLIFCLPPYRATFCLQHWRGRGGRGHGGRVHGGAGVDETSVGDDAELLYLAGQEHRGRGQEERIDTGEAVHSVEPLEENRGTGNYLLSQLECFA